MLKRLEYIFLVGSIGLTGADRVDLFLGHGFFRLTPFLVFSSLAVLILVMRRIWHGRLQFAVRAPYRRQIPFLIALALFLFVAFASTILGLDPQHGLVSLFGLVLVSLLGYYVSTRILSDPQPETLVVPSVTLALIVWLIFCVGGYIAWTHGATRLQEDASSSLGSMFAPTATLYWIPRLSGYCLDANRAGFILVIYLALLDRFTCKTRYTNFLRFVIACFILLAVSRSAMLCWAAYYLFSRDFWRRLATRRAILTAATLAIVCLLLGLAFRREISTLADLWQLSEIVSDRLSSDPGSTAGSHIQLIQRGFDTWTTSTRTVVVGIGYQGASRVLNDFFQDNKYANFHDVYVTVLAELGLPAFLLFMTILVYPIIGRQGAAPFVAAIVVFNVFLQSYLEPIFWLALALVWSFERKRLKLLQLGLGGNVTPSVG